MSQAEVIRQAPAQMIVGQKYQDIERTFGAWSREKVKSREFVEELRKEWEK